MSINVIIHSVNAICAAFLARLPNIIRPKPFTAASFVKQAFFSSVECLNTVGVGVGVASRCARLDLISFEVQRFRVIG